MVSIHVKNTIEKVFPNVEVLEYAENEAYIQVDELRIDQVKELVEETSCWSGCEWRMESSDEKIQIVFTHTAFS